MQAVLGKVVGTFRGVGAPLKASGSILLGNGSGLASAAGSATSSRVWHGFAIIGTNRFYATTRTASDNKEPEKSVFISQSTDIHTNLALEDWIYRNFNFENHRVLLLWRNDPCVVIGRHQNPWTEVDVSLAEEAKLPVVRRNSGGGCVYHDQGNLNCTFFTPRDGYDRKSNLEIICRALKRQFDIDADVSPRLDVNVQGYKISGTAAKLGKNAYHHCTLLVDADIKKLSALLNPDVDEKIESKATKSIKSPVKNLKSQDPTISVDKVLSSVGYEFLRSDSTGNDGGEKQIQHQRGFQMVNPTNEWFPGLEKIRSDLKGWEWNYGKTPDFSVDQSYPIGLGRANQDGAANIDLHLRIVKGRIENSQLRLPFGKEQLVDSNTLADLYAFINALKDRPFRMDILATFEGLLFKKSTQEVSATSSSRSLRDIRVAESLLIA
ncbi:lipoyltransferase 1, mitochondrial [Folsomia candida]|uniref:Lipoyltransferase 1, mitochondrial n=1 Tax=Folsomia candida TaxID=158441 RepID=A0A226ELD5_FOLCA|nr:lipoyltransferase 1, mitochondrial [Folsomia candida]OXA57541.1 Lipoyltransferase 1, mitochondrial [Folsomia candida]